MLLETLEALENDLRGDERRQVEYRDALEAAYGAHDAAFRVALGKFLRRWEAKRAAIGPALLPRVVRAADVSQRIAALRKMEANPQRNGPHDPPPKKSRARKPAGKAKGTKR